MSKNKKTRHRLEKNIWKDTSEKDCYRIHTHTHTHTHTRILKKKKKKLLKLKNKLPWWLRGKESACQCRRHGFEPWSGKISHALGQLSMCTTTIEPALLEPGRCICWNPGALEPVLCKKRSHLNEKLSTATREWPPLAATKKSPCSSEDPAQPKINKIIFLNPQESMYRYSILKGSINLLIKLLSWNIMLPSASRLQLSFMDHLGSPPA